MGEQGSHEHEHTPETASGATAGSPQDRDNAHGAIADAPPVSQGRPEHRRNIAAGLIGALALTVVSLVFIASFIGALHAPGPRSVPVGVVGGPAQTSAVSRALDRQTPGGFNVIGYPNEPAARSAITGRIIDAALVPGPRVRLLLVATAVGQSVTAATVKDFGAAAHAARLPATVQNIRPLPPSDPDGLSQVFFVIALLAPSLIFGQQLVSRVSKDLPSLWQLAVIAVYAVIVAAAATAIADPAIGALTGAPWGLFGIGTLLAFAAAVMAAAATRWTGGIGYTVLLLLFIPVGIASSGTTIGPNMITQWYADLGKALLPGSAIPAIQNTVYFNGNNITRPLLILSSWALAGLLAMVMAAILHPPMPGQQTSPPAQDVSATGQTTTAARQPRAAS